MSQPDAAPDDHDDHEDAREIVVKDAEVNQRLQQQDAPEGTVDV